ncbi:MAG: ATP-dependent Clp protease ATP-binding subunit [Lachnospiraceae bacterium]|nr:ATP-dependent Clp protease ATP-binding subunit [Lachnospiraceae bacterium]
MLCQLCNKNTAVVFVNKYENGQTKQVAMCLPCAKKNGLPLNRIMPPGMMPQGMSQEDMENIGEQMNEMLNGSDLGDLSKLIPPEILNMLKGSTRPGEDQDDGDEADGLSMGSGDDGDPIVLDMSPDTPADGAAASAGPSGSGNRNASSQRRRNDHLKTLSKFSTNLTEKARRGEVDNVVGRSLEIDRLMQILNRRTKNNPVLLGEPGVGKTAIAEGFALMIAREQVPIKLRGKEVYLLDMTGLVAGTQFRGQFEARMKAIITEVTQAKNVILVIDEIHNLVGAGDAQNSMNAANILKPALANGSIQIIGTTTLDEYRKYIEHDPALERRFQPIIVDEPSAQEAIEILKGIRPHYENYHNVKISDENIEDAVYLSQRYINQRYLPDKAIDLIDEAGSRVNLGNTALIDLQNLEKTLLVTVQKKEDAAAGEDFETAAACRTEELKLQKEIEELKASANNIPLTYDDLAQVIESWTKIPVKRLTRQESEKLMSLEERLHERVVGQDKAVSAVSRAIRRNRSGFRKERKPASFIFAGPTGVGKTELAKTLCVELFGTEDPLIRIDMSEFMEKHTVSKLIGAPPGYVGFDEGGQLTEKVRRHPFSVVLMDEIEKAHPDVFNMLLQILDDGRLTDSQGRTVNFENTIIIMTTNAGASFKNNGLGFNAASSPAMESSVDSALKQLFRPEFLNRVDEIITFDSLTKKELTGIVDIMLKDVYKAAGYQNMTITVDDDVKSYLVENGYDEKYGARPLRRLIQREVEDEIAEAFLKDEVRSGDALRICLKNGKPGIEKV